MPHQRSLLLIAGLLAVGGCLQTDEPLEYLGHEPLRHYVDEATRIDEPCVENQPNEAVLSTLEPRTLRDRSQDEVWNMPLAEAIHIALGNASVIRSNATFGNSPLLANGSVANTIHDPAIQAANVVGIIGTEAALSDFDTDFTAGITWGRDEAVQNSPFSPAGFGVVLPTVATESAAFQAGLAKRIANGGAISLTHEMNYQGVPPGLFPFPSSYRGNVALGYRQPLWAGAGVEYTRIAGPINASTALTRNVLGEGVVLARINQNISLDDFEAAVRDLVYDTETLYWDLYLQYRLYNAAVTARNSARRTWWELQRTIDLEAGGDTIYTQEAQARDTYFASRAASEQALSSIYSTETRFRRLLGLPVNDGRVIRPGDEPLTAPFESNWQASLAEAMTERVELRRQKWNVKKLELQLVAARDLVNPRFDFVSGYNVNAFGDQLLGYGSDDDAVGSPQGLRYAYESLTQGNQTGWTLGFEFSMPIGFRHALTQQRGIELQLVRAREVLAAQELDVSHELAVAYQSIAQHYQVAKSNYNRRRAAVDRLSKAHGLLEEGRPSDAVSTDLRLRAQTSLAQAEGDYFTSLVDYNKAIANLQLRKGTLLEFNRVFLSEGRWDSAAYGLALRRAEARSNAVDASRVLHTEPREFASPYPVGRPYIAAEQPFGQGELPIDGELIPVPDDLGIDQIPLDAPPAADPDPTDVPPRAPTTGPAPRPIPNGPAARPAEPVEPTAGRQPAARPTPRPVIQVPPRSPRAPAPVAVPPREVDAAPAPGRTAPPLPTTAAFLLRLPDRRVTGAVPTGPVSAEQPVLRVPSVPSAATILPAAHTSEPSTVPSRGTSMMPDVRPTRAVERTPIPAATPQSAGPTPMRPAPRTLNFDPLWK